VARRAAVEPFHVMDVWAAAAEAPAQATVTWFNPPPANPPTDPAPEPVLAAATSALRNDTLGYTVTVGIPELRENIGEHYRDCTAWDVDGDDVVLSTGSSAGSCSASWPRSTPATGLAMARPGYPCYRNILSALGCQVVGVDCGPANRFQPTVEQSRRRTARRADPGQPANPTGTG